MARPAMGGGNWKHFTVNLSRFESGLENIIIVNHAPQLSLLKHASFMINHGGTNTIREYVYFGVPMIAFPLGFDQYGNTARIVYHGLGIEGNFGKVSVPHLKSLVAQVDSSPSFQEKARLMQQSAMQMESREPGIALVEGVLQRHSHRFEMGEEVVIYNAIGGAG